MSLSLKNLQKFVGGPIQAVFCGMYEGQSVLMICHEEGKLRGLPLNFWWDSTETLDYIVGDVIFVRADGVELIGLEGKLDSFRKWCRDQGMGV